MSLLALVNGYNHPLFDTKSCTFNNYIILAAVTDTPQKWLGAHPRGIIHPKNFGHGSCCPLAKHCFGIKKNISFKATYGTIEISGQLYQKKPGTSIIHYVC